MHSVESIYLRYNTQLAIVGEQHQPPAQEPT